MRSIRRDTAANPQAEEFTPRCGRSERRRSTCGDLHRAGREFSGCLKSPLAELPEQEGPDVGQFFLSL